MPNALSDAHQLGLGYKGNKPCKTLSTHKKAKLIVLTGGPGAGKSAVLEIARRNFCKHVAIIPEAASIIFGGGFPRIDTLSGRLASQRAIFHCQYQLEQMVLEDPDISIGLCDRGILDCLAYWPNSENSFWDEVKLTKEQIFSRYEMLIHLRTPPIDQGYNHENPLRTESAQRAKQIDEKIFKVWEQHPNRHIVENKDIFFEKVQDAMKYIMDYIPSGCRL